MATRTVRLDKEAEKVLEEIQQTTGLRVSEALTRGLQALRTEIARERSRLPFEVYRELDIGTGGVAHAASTDVARGVRAALRRKLGR